MGQEGRTGTYFRRQSTDCVVSGSAWSVSKRGIRESFTAAVDDMSGLYFCSGILGRSGGVCHDKVGLIDGSV